MGPRLDRCPVRIHLLKLPHRSPGISLVVHFHGVRVEILSKLFAWYHFLSDFPLLFFIPIPFLKMNLFMRGLWFLFGFFYFFYLSFTIFDFSIFNCYSAMLSSIMLEDPVARSGQLFPLFDSYLKSCECSEYDGEARTVSTSKSSVRRVIK